MTARIGVGIFGASPEGSWGSTAHIPALQALNAFELVSVCNRHAESAAETARRFNLPKSTARPEDIFSDPTIDLVVICMRVPYHFDLANAALESGKHVYCEWPLAATTEQAESLSSRAKAKGLHHAVGLQARFAPVINHVKDLVAQGYIGDVLACTAIYSGPHSSRSAYLQDESSGGTFLAIKGGHTLDTIAYMLGEFHELSAMLACLTPEVEVADTGEIVPRTTFDQIVVTGRLENDAMVVMQLKGGQSSGTGLRVEINGSKGDLVLTSTGHPSIQITPLTLWETKGGDLSLITIPDSHRLPEGIPSGPPENIAQLYSKLAESFEGDTGFIPDFDTGVQNHRLLDRVREAAKTGRRVLVEPHCS